MKYGICLSGGGIKGIAHIGALKAFEECNIQFDCLSGTSSGSIVATLYASGYTCSEMLNIFNKYFKKIKYVDLKNIFNITRKLFKEHKLIIEGLNSGETIENIVKSCCASKGIYNIKDIKKDLVIASVSLNSGDVYIFESEEAKKRYSDNTKHIGNVEIGKAVRASCSFPGIFCPVKFNNDLLIDGGVRENIPWKELINKEIDQLFCITFEEYKKIKKEKNIIDVISGAIDLMGKELYNYEIVGANNIIKIKTEEISLLDYDKMNYLYEQGYKQTKNYLKNNKIINKY